VLVFLLLCMASLHVILLYHLSRYLSTDVVYEHKVVLRNTFSSNATRNC
jgi:hypothetical protein